MSARMPKKPPREDHATEMLRQAGLRLAALREAKGWTQDQLAALIGVGRGALAMWEGGRNAPNCLALARAQMHGIPLEWVLLGITRHIEHGDMQALTERCRALGAVMDRPTPQFPMAAPVPAPVAAVPRRRITQLHEATEPFTSPSRHKQ